MPKSNTLRNSKVEYFLFKRSSLRRTSLKLKSKRRSLTLVPKPVVSRRVSV